MRGQSTREGAFDEAGNYSATAGGSVSAMWCSSRRTAIGDFRADLATFGRFAVPAIDRAEGKSNRGRIADTGPRLYRCRDQGGRLTHQDTHYGLKCDGARRAALAQAAWLQEDREIHEWSEFQNRKYVKRDKEELPS